MKIREPKLKLEREIGLAENKESQTKVRKINSVSGKKGIPAKVNKRKKGKIRNVRMKVG